MATTSARERAHANAACSSTGGANVSSAASSVCHEPSNRPGNSGCSDRYTRLPRLRLVLLEIAGSLGVDTVVHLRGVPRTVESAIRCRRVVHRAVAQLEEVLQEEVVAGGVVVVVVRCPRARPSAAPTCRQDVAEGFAVLPAR